MQQMLLSRLLADIDVLVRREVTRSWIFFSVDHISFSFWGKLVCLAWDEVANKVGNPHSFPSALIIGRHDSVLSRMRHFRNN